MAGEAGDEGNSLGGAIHLIKAFYCSFCCYFSTFPNSGVSMLLALERMWGIMLQYSSSEFRGWEIS